MKKFKVKDALAIGLPTASLAVSSANYVTNSKKRAENKEYQEKQLEVLGKLTDSLEKVDKTLSNPPIYKEPTSKKKKRFRLFQKSNSNTLDMAGKGALIGSSLSFGASPFLPKKIGGKYEKYKTITKVTNNKKNTTSTETSEEKTRFVDDPDFKYQKIRDKYNKLEDLGLRELLISLGGAAIGATLGAIVGAIMDISGAVDRKTTVNARLMKDVLGNLRKSGYKEGKDFTRDPRTANLMKTAVCLVISKSADTLRLLVNTINDKKLKSLSEGIVKNLPAMSTVTEKASDRFNELNITTMTSNNGDATWVSSVAERFITAGYPVYLVEVG